MPVKAIDPSYHGELKDKQERFHGNQLLNVCWEKHTMFGWPMCIPVPPALPFGALVAQILPSIFGSHPDFAKIDWSTAVWTTARGPFTPDLAKSLEEQGIGHKALIRFRTPGLDGHRGGG